MDGFLQTAVKMFQFIREKQVYIGQDFFKFTEMLASKTEKDKYRYFRNEKTWRILLDWKLHDFFSQIFHYISRYWSILYSCKKAEPLYGKSFSGDPFWISEMMDVRQGELVLSTPLCGVIKHSPRSYVQKPKEIYDTNHWPKSEFMARAISGKQPPSVEN